MKEAFEKIVERLEEEKTHQTFCDKEVGYNKGIRKAISIVQKVSEEYSNGWIAISDRFPENDKYILLSFDNFSVPMIGRYKSYESGGAFYIGDEDITCSKQDLFVNAWQPLPEPYQPKGE